MNFSIFPIGSVLFAHFFPYPTSAVVGRCGSFIVLSLSLTLAHIPEVTFALSGPEIASNVLTQSAPPLPSADSPRLRAALLGRATTHLSPKWKNPAVSDRGLNPSIVTALQQQQEYLHFPAGEMNSAHAPVLPLGTNSALPCHDAIIRAVNGKATGAIFTPQTPNNSYRIEGCLFGDIPGHLDLEPHPADPAQRISLIPLTVDSGHSSWSDNKIEVHLDSHLSGIPDVPVTLVVYLAEGRRLEVPGCFFVAARSDPKLLESIPASWISLQPSSVRSHSIERLEYVSPPVKGSGVPADAAGASAFVSRLDAENFGAGADVYDFTQLNPGWVVDSIQLQTYAVACPGSAVTRQSSGHWDTQWNGRRLTIQLQDDVCTSRVSPSFTFNLSVSQYALKVWVVGPVGTKPLADALLHNRTRSLTN